MSKVTVELSEKEIRMAIQEFVWHTYHKSVDINDDIEIVTDKEVKAVVKYEVNHGI